MAALRISVLWLWNLRKAEQGLLTSDVALLLRELLYSIDEDLVVREVVVKAEFILGSDYSNYMTLKIYHISWYQKIRLLLKIGVKSKIYNSNRAFFYLHHPKRNLVRKIKIWKFSTSSKMFKIIEIVDTTHSEYFLRTSSKSI